MVQTVGYQATKKQFPILWAGGIVIVPLELLRDGLVRVIFLHDSHDTVA